MSYSSAGHHPALEVNKNTRGKLARIPVVTLLDSANEVRATSV
jgi:hypothetical protein